MVTREEIVAKQFATRWPRLYLDTAVRNNIGRDQEPLAERLLEAAKSHSVLLVVSFAHIRDAMKPGDRDAPELISNALERFWMRGLVTKGPREIEPWQSGPTDIEVSRWGNVREFLTSPARDKELVEHNDAQDTALVADIMVKAGFRSAAESGPVKKNLSKLEQALVSCAVQCLALGLESDAASAIERCASYGNYTLSDEQRMMLFKQVLPAELALVAWRPYLDKLSDDERSMLLKQLRSTPDLAPGIALSNVVSYARHRDLTRNPDRTDSVDLEHCTYLPYVDVATCDNNVFGAVAKHLSSTRSAIRRVKLFRNGEIAELIRCLEQLPVAETYLQEAIKEMP